MSDDQFKDLKQYLDERFIDQDDRLTQQIADVHNTLSDQILKLYQHMESRFDALQEEVDGKADRKDLDRIYGALDAVLKNQETEQQERAAITTQLDRHERWHHQTADTLHLKLDY